LNYLFRIAKNFTINDSIISIEDFGSGNINDTYLVKTKNYNRKKYLLQKINTTVFKKPELLMNNISTVTEHIEKKLLNNRKWKIFSVIKTKKGQGFWISGDNCYWRMISYIEDSESFDVIQSTEQAFQLGSALGTFHNLVDDLLPNKLANVLEDFHITPAYLKHYDQVIKSVTESDQQEINYGHTFIANHRHTADVLEQAKTNQTLPLRIMHGDPKINNVMFNHKSGKAISIIDLDTVEPGLIHYDIGDCIRSSCNPTGEDAGTMWKSVYFDVEIFQYILSGYIKEMKSFLTEDDYHYIYDAIFIITFELAIRFFTDYLEGNVYFKKIDYKEQNLHRGLTQFRLAESIQNQKCVIQEIIQKVKNNQLKI